MKSLLCAIITATGLISADAALLTYDANLDGPSESPPNGSPATGFGEAIFDTVNNTLSLSISFSGLLGTTTASHIHAATPTPGTGTAGVATTTPYFAGFPIGVTSGWYNTVLDLTQSSSYNPSYIVANGGTPASAEAALTTALAAGTAYLNIHSTVFGNGEIRGFFFQVPEPSSLALFALGGIAVATRAWRNRRPLSSR